MRLTHPHIGVVALAHRQLADIEAAANRPMVPDGLIWAAEGLLAAGAQRRAAQFAAAAIWFGGAQQALAQEHAPIDPGDTIVSQIDAAEVCLQDFRHRVNRQIGALARHPSGPRLSAALRAAACSSADLYDALVRFKWAVIERDMPAGDSDFFDWLQIDAGAAGAQPSGLAGLRAAVPVLRQSWWQRKAVDLAL